MIRPKFSSTPSMNVIEHCGGARKIRTPSRLVPQSNLPIYDFEMLTRVGEKLGVARMVRALDAD
jgi:hypothetical protein